MNKKAGKPFSNEQNVALITLDTYRSKAKQNKREHLLECSTDNYARYIKQNKTIQNRLSISKAFSSGGVSEAVKSMRNFIEKDVEIQHRRHWDRCP